MYKLELKNITLVCVTSLNIEEHIKALIYSSKDINFGKIKIISYKLPENLPDYIEYNYMDITNNIDEWNHFIVYDLHKYIETEYCILIHDDGFIVNPSSWRAEFLEYDYIGAPWGHKFYDSEGNLIRCGNSVSLRSKKLLEIPSKYEMPWVKFDNNYNEDTQICVHNRDFFLNKGIKYADFEIAKYFSHEEYFTEYNGINPFCFHNFGGVNEKYKKIINN
jgi:hypothetical protein